MSYTPEQLQSFVQKKVLDNGMTILLCKRTQAPKVLVQIAYNVGSASEQEGERGLAHLLEHMIFKGTDKNLKEGDIDAIARKYGADFNAFTSHDMTSYYFEADKANWQHFVPVLAECMEHARFDKQHLASEVKAVIQELRMYRDSAWHTMLDNSFAQLYPSHHPYHQPIIGYKEDLADITPGRLEKFYKKYYHPGRAVLCIIGDIEMDEAAQLAEKSFGSITKTGEDALPVFQEFHPDFIGKSSVFYRDVQTEQVSLYWRIPGMSAQIEHIVSGLEYILGGSVGARLHKRLVDQEQVASNVRVSGEQLFYDGLFMITASIKPGMREKAIKYIHEEVQRILSDGPDGISDAEMKSMKNTRQRQFWQYLQSAQSLAYAWLESFYITGDEHAIFTDIKYLLALEKSDVQNFVREWLAPIKANESFITNLPESHREEFEKTNESEEKYYEKLLTIHHRTAPLETPTYVHTLPEPRKLEFQFPKPHDRVELHNGLKILTHEMRGLPLVTGALMFKDASYFVRSIEGFGIQVMMSMLLEGSQKYSREELLAFFDERGAQYGYHERGASFTCTVDKFAEISEHFFHVLTDPSFSEKELEKIKANLVQGLIQKKDSPRDIGMRALRSKIYGKNHPYSWSFDEAIEYANNLTIDDIKKLHEKHIGPGHMVCALVGDIESDQLILQGREIFESWTGSGYEPVNYPETQSFAPEDISIEMLRDQSVLLFGKPSDIKLLDPDNLVLDLLSIIGFYSLGSRLYALRERTGLFYTASGGFANDVHAEHGYDYVMLMLNKENVTGAKQSVQELLDKLGAEGVSENELKAAQQLYSKDLIDVAAHGGAIAAMLTNCEILDLGFDYYDKNLSRVQNMDISELHRVAKEYISGAGYSTVTVGRSE